MTSPAPTQSDVLRDRRQALLETYGVRAPRYTSYPTAAQFTASVDAGVHAGWLASVPETEPVSLYVHVPFCRRLCWYCGCNTRVVNGAGPVSRYVGRLREELASVVALAPAKLKATRIHLGGGTPNVMSRDDLAILFDALRQVFRIPAAAEISAEIDPVVLTEDWARAAVFHGLTRVSLGVQDLTPIVQQAVNRNEPFSVVVDAVRILRGLGVGSVNFDLMYGLPLQRTSDVLNTLAQVLTLRPDRLALFGYAHVPWMKPNQKLIDEVTLPDAVERLDQSEAAVELLTAEGYVRIGLDHFALPTDPLAVAASENRVTRDFQGYGVARPATLLGFGVSAISEFRQGLAQNHATELAWGQALDHGLLPTARGVTFSAQDRLRGEIIERLMCDFQVDLAAVCAAHGFPAITLDSASPALAALEADGLVTRAGSRVSVMEVGRPYVRAVCAAFDAYLEPDVRRHALAV